MSQVVDMSSREAALSESEGDERDHADLDDAATYASWSHREMAPQTPDLFQKQFLRTPSQMLMFLDKVPPNTITWTTCLSTCDLRGVMAKD